MAKIIPLHRDGLFAVVDDQDYESLKTFKWFAVICKKTVYAIRTYRVDGKRFTLSMHRDIMKNPAGVLVDHRDGHGWHCCRSNLRTASTNQNAWNGGVRKNSKTGVTGVNWSKKAKRWRAYITVNYKMRTVGWFTDFSEAVSARKAAEKEFFGEFARQPSQIAA